ncbi:heme-binding protein [Olivibacter sp. 47]|uniref:GlcG/HbpS family heme-binding protein n=1 Tax=Olivibacter sp. 47 TaxID=3056486 RepID=UPI0025A499CE|nr:heme-binding protein [Olivibacter sp. 47]MDM8173091.1 heme-binding protein [Olivibacter sp. 47]
MEINLNESRQVVQQARAKAIQLNVNVNIAILDTGGHLKTFERMDDAFLGSMDIAIKKAKTASLFRTSSENVGEYLKPEAGTYGMVNTNNGLVGFAGGLPILKDKRIIGYIGVSGGAVSEDLQIATAGAEIFNQN